jgi:saccharopine dehydrogenase-like NADP-dependent oxidoreductase
MKTILLFGAGKSATVLIDYLKDLAGLNNYSVLVADSNLENVQSKVGQHALVQAIYADVEDETARKKIIKAADVVISLLPPSLHYLVAVDCLQLSKNLLTASYIDDRIKALAKDIDNKKILFLCEMGLDPGIDHMGAMELIDRIKKLGGKITSFKSHCGGLVAPESDTNPWHYKISWNPRNVVVAGKAGATFRQNSEEKFVPYEEIFTSVNTVNVTDDYSLAYYPNRDSLSYIPLYKLEGAATFVRATLRHPDFCFGWKNIIDLKLTDESPAYETDGLSLANFFKTHLDKYNLNHWLNEMLVTRLHFAKDVMDNMMKLMEAENELQNNGGKTDESIMLVNENGELNTLQIEDVKGQAAATLAEKMHEADLTLKQLFFLGLDSEELIDKGTCSAADVLQFILEKKLALEATDKDMVVMVHEFEYELDGKKNYVKSTLQVKGEDNVRTAMAKTVGLPLGIAAKLILDGTLTATGLHIPISADIYQPVLRELRQQGILFEEKFE